MRRIHIIGMGLLFLPTTAFAQLNVRTTAITPDIPPYAAIRPYWVDRPIIEVIGRANVEFAPNRANFSIKYFEVDTNSDEATRKVTDRVRPGLERARSLIGNKGTINATYSRTTLYEQYRDREGNRNENEREDKISNYVAYWTIEVNLTEMSIISAVRAELLAIGGAEMNENIEFEFEPTPEQARSVIAAAANDGFEQAKMVANIHGMRPRLLVFEEGRTQCLASATTRGATTSNAPTRASNEMIVVTGSRLRKLTPEEMNLPVAPNPIESSAQVCMVYALE